MEASAWFVVITKYYKLETGRGGIDWDSCLL